MVSFTEIPNGLNSHEIWFTNLLLLGFDPLFQEHKHNLKFSRDMFVLPNCKGMEVVLHFLFSQLPTPISAMRSFETAGPSTTKNRKICSERSAATGLLT